MKRFSRRGRRGSKRWGGRPSAKSLLSEKADPGAPSKPGPFKFVLVAVRLPSSDPRGKSIPTQASAFYAECRAALSDKTYFRSLGHVPLKPRTVVLLIEYRGSRFKAPILRVYSSPNGWKRMPEAESK